MINKRDLLSAVLTLTLATSLLGCNGSDDGEDAPVSLVGTWDANSATVSSPELPGGPVTVSSALGMLSGTITFNADGTFATDIDITIIGESYSFAGTWSASSSELKMTSEGERGEASYVISGRSIIVTYERDGSTIAITASKR